MQFFDRQTIQRQLLHWYERHGRQDLPWQQEPTPYRVWVSEIMLQQTQVATVIPYYQRFTQRFPTIEKLATASLDEVLQLWAGLGYYSRGRNLHRTAQIILTEFNGQFPNDLSLLRQLPGIGEYTAGAIMSFAFRQPAAIVDGNVKRVISRLHTLPDWPGHPTTHRLIWEIASHYTPAADCHLYNQAIMDLGATVCTRKRPDCDNCPWQTHCQAYRQRQTDRFPVAKPAKEKPTQERYFLLLQDDRQNILLHRRPPTGIWGGLWSLPECALHENIGDWCEQQYGLFVKQQQALPKFKHSFSHYHLLIHPLALQVHDMTTAIREQTDVQWCTNQHALTQGIPSPVKQLLEQYQ
jgi:A/G-specific adenine glycosylase